MWRLLFWVGLSLGIALLSQGSYLQLKAELAQYLLARSWQTRAPTSRPGVPWGWADSHVIARLQISSASQPLYVMNNDSGEALAFGPGHLAASALPAASGHSIIAGHRDSHFKELANLRLGDQIHVQNFRSQIVNYRVINLRVIDTTVEQIPVLEGDFLTLVTCYPFNALNVGGPLRYLVLAERIDSSLAGTPMALGSQQQTEPNHAAQPTVI